MVISRARSARAAALLVASAVVLLLATASPALAGRHTCVAAPAHDAAPPATDGALTEGLPPGRTVQGNQTSPAAASPAAPDASTRPCPDGEVPQPEGQAGRKGRPSASSTSSAVTPPAPGSGAYLYAGGDQYYTGIGGYVELSQPAPFVNAGDSHSLAEMAVESSDGRQIVEIGTTVDPGLNGDRQPHLFVFHWINGNPTCYNGCGYVQTSPTIRPGMVLSTTNATSAFQIQEASGSHEWWLYYGGTAIGYFPASEWGGGFTRSGLTQWFGEVSAANSTPCTNMGNSLKGSQGGSARINNTVIVLPGSSFLTASPSGNVTNAGLYDTSGGRSFGYGGPGAC